MNSFPRFCLVGGAGFLTDSAVLLALTGIIGMPPLSARIFSFVIAVVVTWIGNTMFSFRDSGRRLSLRSFTAYLTYQSLGMALNMLVYSALIIAGQPPADRPLIALSIASAAAMAFNYLVLWKIHFRKPAE